MHIYRFTKSVKMELYGETYDFKGAKAKLDSSFGDSHGVVVEGYGVMAFMISKKVFADSTEFVGQYAEFKVSNNKLKNKMAKKEVSKEAVADTAVMAIDSAIKVELLPEIPDKFTIGGVEFSVADIEKAVSDVKKHTIKDPKDKDAKKTYAYLKKKATEFQRTRTGAAKFRTDKARPINAWLSTFKKKVEDEIGSAARIGEDYCRSQMEVYENHEAEIKRQEEEAKQKLVTERSKVLLELGGQMNPESEHWTFPYAPHIIVEKKEMEVEIGWEEIAEKVKSEHEEHLKKAEAEKKAVEAAKSGIISARGMVLEMMGYSKTEEGFEINGNKLSNDDVASLSEDDFKATIEAHKTANTNPNPFQNATVSMGSNDSESAPDTPVNPFENATVAQEPVKPTPRPTFGGNAFGAFLGNSATVEPVVEVEEEIEEVLLSNFTEEEPFVDKLLKNSRIRIYDTRFENEALKNIPDIDNNTLMQGKFENHIGFIIYK